MRLVNRKNLVNFCHNLFCDCRLSGGIGCWGFGLWFEFGVRGLGFGVWGWGLGFLVLDCGGLGLGLGITELRELDSGVLV